MNLLIRHINDYITFEGLSIQHLCEYHKNYVYFVYLKLMILYKESFNMLCLNLVSEVNNYAANLDFKDKTAYLEFIIRNRIIINNSFYLTKLYDEYIMMLNQFIDSISSVDYPSNDFNKYIKNYKRLFYPEDEILYFYTSHRRLAYVFDSFDDFYKVFNTAYSISNQKFNEELIDQSLSSMDENNKVVLTKSDFYKTNLQLINKKNSFSEESSAVSERAISEDSKSNKIKEEREEEKEEVKEEVKNKLIFNVFKKKIKAKIHLKELPDFKKIKVENINKKLLTRIKKELKMKEEDYVFDEVITKKFINSELNPPFSEIVNDKNIAFKSVSVSYLKWLLSHDELRNLFNSYIEEHFDEELELLSKDIKNDVEERKNLESYLNKFVYFYTN